MTPVNLVGGDQQTAARRESRRAAGPVYWNDGAAHCRRGVEAVCKVPTGKNLEVKEH